METIFEQWRRASEMILLLRNPLAADLLGVAYSCCLLEYRLGLEDVSSMLRDFLSSSCTLDGNKLVQLRDFVYDLLDDSKCEKTSTL